MDNSTFIDSFCFVLSALQNVASGANIKILAMSLESLPSKVCVQWRLKPACSATEAS